MSEELKIGTLVEAYQEGVGWNKGTVARIHKRGGERRFSIHYLDGPFVCLVALYEF
jgi:hypothetical protein